MSTNRGIGQCKFCESLGTVGDLCAECNEWDCTDEAGNEVIPRYEPFEFDGATTVQPSEGDKNKAEVVNKQSTSENTSEVVVDVTEPKYPPKFDVDFASLPTISRKDPPQHIISIGMSISRKRHTHGVSLPNTIPSAKRQLQATRPLCVEVIDLTESDDDLHDASKKNENLKPKKGNMNDCTASDVEFIIDRKGEDCDNNE
jgi:hypothetical protein